MKKLILPLVMGLMLGSCSRDNDEVVADNNAIITPVETSVLPTKITYENGFSELKYDGDKLLEMVNAIEGEEVQKMTFKYDGDKIVELNTENQSAKYNYTDNKLSSSTSYMEEEEANGNKVISSTTREYTYNINGTVGVVEKKQVEHTTMPMLNSSRTRNYTYTITNGNLMQVVMTVDGNTTTTTYTYGQKHTLFKNIKGFDLLLLELIDDDILGINVSKNEELSSETQINGQFLEKFDFVYEYNANGYPTKITEKKVNSDNRTYEYIMNFEYNK